MFKILFILPLIVFSSTGFSAQINVPEPIPFIVFSTTGFSQNVNVLQPEDKINGPKPALKKSNGPEALAREPIYSDFLLEFSDGYDISDELLNLSSELLESNETEYALKDLLNIPTLIRENLSKFVVETTSIYRKIGDKIPNTMRSLPPIVLSFGKIIKDFNNFVGSYRNSAQCGYFAKDYGINFILSLNSILGYFNKSLTYLSRLYLNINYNQPIGLMNKIRNHLTPILAKLEKMKKRELEQYYYHADYDVGDEVSDRPYFRRDLNDFLQTFQL